MKGPVLALGRAIDTKARFDALANDFYEGDRPRKSGKTLSSGKWCCCKLKDERALFESEEIAEQSRVRE